MARLLETGPAQGLGLPLAVGGATRSEVVLGPAWSIALFRGQEAANARALGVVLLPAPALMEPIDGVRLIWAGPGQALLVGRAAPDGLDGIAAVVEQGDGLVGLRPDGPAARYVLARLVPLNLRDGAFPEGGTARTLLGSMSMTLLRSGANCY
ncbi:sarcosine oxidase subunit gamma [Rubellimicrobium rubrum]|uniref:Sarcosine oxidase subunit gamma n=1 Tax=Rubellimicrobium rubrum TaxID=2585369 RepID=A0A5C4N1D5_9RHOB|nr:sarcosine oxidase subunit gamma [Rubellimicrobium rubrum]TNC51935.1 sarcosine oxidase subunit gamma [Rubellimicrobium rubrum]